MGQTGSRRHPHSCPVVFPPSLEVSSNDAGACLQILSNNFQTLRTEKGTKIRGWAGNDEEAAACRRTGSFFPCHYDASVLGLGEAYVGATTGLGQLGGWLLRSPELAARETMV